MALGRRKIPSKSASAIRKRAILLAQKPALNFFDLAQAISALHEKDPSELSDLVKRIGMSRRRVYYLLQVGELTKVHGISKADAEKVGWTKLQIIARHIAKMGGETSADLAYYLTLAATTKARDLPAALVGRKLTSTRAVQFHLSSGLRSEVNLALVSFGAKRGRRGLLKKERALLRIVRAAMAERS